MNINLRINPFTFGSINEPHWSALLFFNPKCSDASTESLHPDSCLIHTARSSVYKMKMCSVTSYWPWANPLHDWTGVVEEGWCGLTRVRGYDRVITSWVVSEVPRPHSHLWVRCSEKKRMMLWIFFFKQGRSFQTGEVLHCSHCSRLLSSFRRPIVSIL